MTGSALKNKEIDANKEIAAEKNKTEITKTDKTLEDKEKERQWKGRENKRDRAASIISSVLKGAGSASIHANDPEFYKQYLPDLPKFTNLPTYQRVGSEVWTKDYIIRNGFNTHVALGVKSPGIMTLSWLPTIGNQIKGQTSYANNPVNQILMRSKEQVLKLNSRSSVNWEPADLGLNIFCTSDIITKLLEIRRALLAYQTYQGDNAYFAEALVTALGYNFNDIVTHQAEYKKRLQVLITRFNNSIVAPASLTLFARRAFLAVNIFTDHKDFRKVKQMYAYKAAGHLKLDLTGSGADFVSDIGVKLMSTDLTEVAEMIQRIVENPDYVEMYADLRHAWKNLYQLDPIFNVEDKVIFNTDDRNREQIHNVKTLPVSADGDFYLSVSQWGLQQDSAGYLYQPGRSFNYSAGGLTSNQRSNLKDAVPFIYGNGSDRKGQLMDTYHTPIDGDDILDLSRTLFTISKGEEDSSGVLSWQVESCGTEVVYFTHIFTYAEDYDLQEIKGGTTVIDFPASSYLAYSSVKLMTYSCLLTKFDWHPITEIMNLNTANVISTLWNVVGNMYNVTELDNSFVIDNKDVTALNEACVLSELYLKESSFSYTR